MNDIFAVIYTDVMNIYGFSQWFHSFFLEKKSAQKHLSILLNNTLSFVTSLMMIW